MILLGDYIAYKLSEVINNTILGLSEGFMWDFKNDRLANFFFEYYGISTDLVSGHVDTFCIQSKVDKKGAAESGLAEVIPILYRAGDQPNNAISLNVFNPSEVAATVGTWGMAHAMLNSLSLKKSSRVNNFAHVNYKKGNEPRIKILLCINGAGIQYRWLLKNRAVASYEEIHNLSSEIPIGFV